MALGDDRYAVDNLGDTVTENLNEGTDSVNSLIAYTLGDNLENLYLSGADNIDGTGNALDNILGGNSANNTLTGGLGNDIYYVQNPSPFDTSGGSGQAQGDAIVENLDAGIDQVYSTADYTLDANVEHLTLNESASIGTGNGLDNIIIGNNTSNHFVYNYQTNLDYRLSGEAGNDILDGGAGNDIMDGRAARVEWKECKAANDAEGRMRA